MALPVTQINAEKFEAESVGDLTGGDVITSVPTPKGQLSVIETRRELIFASLALFVALLVRVAADLLQFDDSAYFQYWYSVGSTFLGFTVLFFSCGSTFRGALLEISERRFGAPLCLSLGLVALASGAMYGLFFDFVKLAASPLWGSMLCVGWFVALGSLLQAYIDRRSARAIGYNYPPLQNAAPLGKTAINLESAPELKLYERGQKLVLGANEWVPVDATIVGGKGEVWERRYGGALRRRFKSKGQELFAGSYVKAGELQCVVVSKSSESTIVPFVEALNGILRGEMRAPLRKALLSTAAGGLIFTAACVVLFWRERGASTFDLFDLAAGVLLCVAYLRLLSYSFLPTPIAITKLFLKGCLLRGSSVLAGLAKARHLVMSYQALERFRKLRVVRFDLLDNRIDKQGLCSVILALCGDGEDAISEAVFDAVSREVANPMLHEVSEYRLYTGRGLCGTIQGADLSLGNEAFLIERGVQLQPSDVPALQPGEQALYFAVKDEVMARFIVAHQVSGEDEGSTLSQLQRSGIRPVLCGAEDSAAVDALAKEIQLDLSSSHGGLKKPVMIEKFESWRPLALYSGDEFDPELSARAEASILNFSELRWNIADSDVTLYRPSLGLIIELIVEARSAVKKSRVFVLSGLLVALISLPLAFLAFVPPVLALAGAAACQVVALLLIRAPTVLEIEG